MKNSLLLLLLVGSTLTAFGQFGSQQIISTATISPYQAKTWDVDADGDIDVLTASGETFSLSWYENTDGEGTFSDENIITAEPAYYLSIDFVDMDGDNDKDLLLLENNPNRLLWLENTDGNGQFSVEHILFEEEAEYKYSVLPADLDSDGDLDLVVEYGDTFSDRIVAFENLEGIGTFGPETVLLDEDIQYTKPLLADMNDDSLPDLLIAEDEHAPARIFWLRNNSNITFDSPQEIYQFEFFISDNTSVTHMEMADLDTDGINDLVISTTNSDTTNTISWFKGSNDGTGFGPINNLFNFSFNYILGDIDNDTDIDILGRNGFLDTIFWYRNEDSLGLFGEQQLITDEVDAPRALSIADINDDGYIDLVSTSVGDNIIAWYPGEELGLEEQNNFQFTLYPNPVSDKLFIITDLQVKECALYDATGRLVTVLFNQNRLDVSSLSSGIYYLTIISDSDEMVKRKIIKK
ncbi:T9SS type A sorting domain-containing protein [Luteirhabdus pelagi]|uniref:T9SS type A sorting domain-containing protein n=1 Tax=Luteirhabdus pelagi TaxID=2792783 RepID=UPI0019398A1D|nr:T9SS type A sorting domain-containing protein [Luteirhabdus pelagi]